VKLLTFLGTSPYTRVTYVWDSRAYETDLFPEALAVWHEPSEMLVLLTAEAKRHANWTNLRARLSGKVALNPVDIPSGRSEAELWQIFETLTDCLSEGDEVIFDVTHAFRSLPILTLLSAAYLRVAKSVHLRALLYGAFEAKDENNCAPVFDLTPFLSLLDWVTATDKFVKTGDARELASLLRAAHNLPWKSASPQDRQHLPRYLQGLGTTLESLSQALALARPHEVTEHAAGLAERLDTAAVETERWAQPFTVLLGRTRSAYAPFAANTLAAQRELVRWYVERGHVVQAVTLAREWLVSWACCHLGKDQLAEREDVEEAINQASRRRCGEAVENESPLLTPLTALPNADTLMKAWDTVSDLRNDVAHCGMRLEPRPASKIVQSAAKLVDQMDCLSLPKEETA
jgi:CRISPR-associated DxTHG motif protein